MNTSSNICIKQKELPHPFLDGTALVIRLRFLFGITAAVPIAGAAVKRGVCFPQYQIFSADRTLAACGVLLTVGEKLLGNALHFRRFHALEPAGVVAL